LHRARRARVRPAPGDPVRPRLPRGADDAVLRPGRGAAVSTGRVRLREAARSAHLAQPLPAAIHGGLRVAHPGPVQAERRGARAAALPSQKWVLDCADYAGLDLAAFAPKQLVRAEARSARALAQLVALDGDFDVAAHLDAATAAWLLANPPAHPERLVLTVSN